MRHASPPLGSTQERNNSWTRKLSRTRGALTRAHQTRERGDPVSLPAEEGFGRGIPYDHPDVSNREVPIITWQIRYDSVAVANGRVLSE